MCDLNTNIHLKHTGLLMCLLSQVAIKSIRKERITDDLDRIHIQREIEITASLRHSNIIRFHEGESATHPKVPNIVVNDYIFAGRFLDFSDVSEKVT